jgi:hypothetical protein
MQADDMVALLLQSSEHTLVVYVVIEEDGYETLFGDGTYEGTFKAASRSREQALRSVPASAEPFECQFHTPCFCLASGPGTARFHLIEATLTLADDERVVLAGPFFRDRPSAHAVVSAL